MKKYIITDTHINHKNIIKYDNHPEDYESLIFNQWNDIVNEDDDVYHLGDVIFSRAGELGNILKNLNGNKYMCKGNHDHNKKQWYVNKGFLKCEDYFIINNDILLSHKPLDISLIEEIENVKIKFNIHGHFHKTTIEEFNYKIKMYPFYSMDKHILLTLEDNYYKPIELYDFFKMKNKKYE